jgi:hypothetical protein
MGSSDRWVIIINILINIYMDYLESKSEYSCPSYCGVNHQHIKAGNGVDTRKLGNNSDHSDGSDGLCKIRGKCRGSARKGQGSIRAVE